MAGRAARAARSGGGRQKPTQAQRATLCVPNRRGWPHTAEALLVHA